MPHSPELTVFVVDDDTAIRASLLRALGLRGYSVEAFASAQEFLEGYDMQRQGCLVLDYGMPGMDGLELQRQLNEAGVTLPIIFITGHGGVPESVTAIKAGALDFLEKPFRQTDLLNRVETAFAMVRTRLDAEAESLRRQARFDRLTAREMEIVRRIIDHPAEISSKEIAQHLGISPRTVDHHRARILEKLEVRSVAEMIALSRGL